MDQADQGNKREAPGSGLTASEQVDRYSSKASRKTFFGRYGTASEPLGTIKSVS